MICGRSASAWPTPQTTGAVCANVWRTPETIPRATTMHRALPPGVDRWCRAGVRCRIMVVMTRHKRLSRILVAVFAISLATNLFPWETASARTARELERAVVRAPEYRATVMRLPAGVRELMIGSSWHLGCPVGLNDLRLIKLTDWGFDRQAPRGKLIVHRPGASP